jgi:hypothetical protein
MTILDILIPLAVASPLFVCLFIELKCSRCLHPHKKNEKRKCWIPGPLYLPPWENTMYDPDKNDYRVVQMAGIIDDALGWYVKCDGEDYAMGYVKAAELWWHLEKQEPGRYCLRHLTPTAYSYN